VCVRGRSKIKRGRKTAGSRTRVQAFVTALVVEVFIRIYRRGEGE
jgi:hypothetical protein